MANLIIITIIGIVLLAVLAIAGILYASTTMDNSQAQSWATTLISQSIQENFAKYGQKPAYTYSGTTSKSQKSDATKAASSQ